MENVKEKQQWPVGPLCAPCVEYLLETLDMFPDPPVLCRQIAYEPLSPPCDPKICSNCEARLPDLVFSNRI
jgi:hypothetical protein